MGITEIVKKEFTKLNLFLLIFGCLVLSGYYQIFYRFYGVDFIPSDIDGEFKVVLWLSVFLSLKWAVSVFINVRETRSFYETDFKSLDVFLNDWEIQGYSYISEDGLIVTNSSSGILLKSSSTLEPKKWRNFELTVELEFKKFFSNENYEKLDLWESSNLSYFKEFKNVLGILFHAQSLEDYIMIELWKKGNEILIRPHIKVNGNWDAPLYNSHYFSLQLKVNNSDLRIFINVKDGRVQIYNNRLFKNKFDWIIPDYYRVNLVQNINNDKGDLLTRKIPFLGKSGQIGFRNFGDEIAVVKYLKIVPSK